MDPLQAKINLEADLTKIADVIAQNGWKIDPQPLSEAIFQISMASAIDNEVYAIRLVCDNYPDQPPSIKCVVPGTSDASDIKMWANCEGFRPPPTADLCLSISREGLQQLHPDWAKDRRYAWSSDGNPIWYVLQALQDRLDDSTKYHGRQK